MRKQCEHGMSKHGYGSHDCRVQGYACWKQVHMYKAALYTANDWSFVLLTRDGNGCQVFSAIGQSTLPSVAAVQLMQTSRESGVKIS